ncbi:MAG: UbiD family decarboxylase [Magnetococcales bacterium]|nr:UbiD family decarboxylase [Magnetococcales bacterium]
MSRAFADLREFLALLERHGELIRVGVEVDPKLEIVEISRRLLAMGGPAVVFDCVRGSEIGVVANLFGSERRIGLALGRLPEELEALGGELARLKQPQAPAGLKDLFRLGRLFARGRFMPVRTVWRPRCREVEWRGDAVDLGRLPVLTCWPGDAGPLVTWPLVITRGSRGGPVNIGVYRMQVLGRNRLIVRWLKTRGGALHAKEYQGKMPVAVAIGCDPATMLAAVTPIPETLSEYAFAGLLRERRVDTTPGLYPGLPVPATAEIVLEGTVDVENLAKEGPFGDHTGYYNEVERFPVMTVERITMRRDPLYLGTYTGRPPDEPAILALALNRVFTPLLRQQFPEITCFHLSLAAASYRIAFVGLKKAYPGHAFRVMAGVWSFLRQFLLTKYVIVVDDGVDLEDPAQIMAAVTRHCRGGRDLVCLTHTPIDYLDFASRYSGLGGKLGIDATTKEGTELEGGEVFSGETLVRSGAWIADMIASNNVIIDVHLHFQGAMAVVVVDGKTEDRGEHAARILLERCDSRTGPRQFWIVDDDCRSDSWDDLLWSLATRTDPGRDLVLDAPTGRFVVNATRRTYKETGRHWGQLLTPDPDTAEKVTRRWSEYGFAHIGLPRKPLEYMTWKATTG